MSKGIGFTDEFRQDGVAQFVERVYAVSEVAERLGISTKSLYTWKAQFAKSPRVRSEVAEQAAEIKRLKRELARMTEERTILKKAAAYFARVSVKYAFIEAHRSEFSVRLMCPRAGCAFQRVPCMALRHSSGRSGKARDATIAPCIVPADTM